MAAGNGACWRDLRATYHPREGRVEESFLEEVVPELTRRTRGARTTAWRRGSVRSFPGTLQLQLRAGKKGQVSWVEAGRLG